MLRDLNTSKLKTFTVALVILLTMASPVIAASHLWVGAASTNWNTAANWSPAGVPNSADVVLIGPGSTNSAYVPASGASVSRLIFTNSGVLRFEAGATLNVVSNTTSTTSPAIDLKSGGSLQLGSGILVCSGSVRVRSGTTMNLGSGQLTMLGSPLRVDTSTAFNAGTGLVYFNGGSAQSITTGGTGVTLTFYNLIVGTRGTLTSSVNLNVLKNATIETGSTLSMSSSTRTFAVQGNYVNNGTGPASSGKPYVLSITTPDIGTVLILFSETMNTTQATNSYFITNSSFVVTNAARVSTNTSMVQIKMTPLLTNNVQYTLRITNAADSGGTAVAANTYKTFAIVTNAPVPALASISPSTNGIGGALFTMTLTGTNFLPTSIVRLNNTNQPTTYLSVTQLQAIISDTFSVTNGTFPVVVSNPPPGGGVSSTQNFLVGVVNHAPTFTPGGDVSVSKNSGSQTISSWAASLSQGAGDMGQTLTFTVTNDNNALFSTQPAVSVSGANGILTFTPASNAVGSANVTVVLHDNGGTANGGSDTSASQSFVINVGEASITSADGSVSADTAAGSYTTLAGPVYAEGADGDVGVGTIILNAPTGFQFDTGGTAPTVKINRLVGSGGNSNNINGVASGTAAAITSRTAGQITFTVNSSSTNGVVCSLTWQNVRVRPAAGTPLASGDLTATGTATLANVASGSTSFGSLMEISGSAAALSVVTQPSSVVQTNTPFAPQPEIGIVDQFGNLLSAANGNSDSSTVVTAARGTGTGTLNGTLTATADDGVASFSDLYFTNAGTKTLTFTKSGLTGTNSASLEVQEPSNHAPTLGSIPNVTILEDAGTQTVPLTGLGTGYASETQVLTITATSSSTSLIPTPTVTYTSPDATGSLSFAPAANANGTVTITVVVQDDGGTADNGADSVTNTFTVTVTAVNDAPTLAAISSLALLEGAGTQTVNLSGIAAGASESQTLSVTATSSDTSVVPNPTVTYASASTTGRLSFTPVANASGVATISVVASDNGGTANGGVNAVTNTFSVTVTAVNDAPTLAAPPSLTILEDVGTQTVSLGGITAGGGESQTLTVTASSSNTSLVSAPVVTYASPNATGSLSFASATNVSGTVTISVVVSDDGGTLNGGVDAVTSTFRVVVTAVNDAPTLAAIPNLTILEDSGSQTVNLSGITAGASESQTLTVTATSSDTGVIPNPSATYTSANTTGRLAFTPATNAFGTVTISVVVSDNGGTANGGVNSITNTFTVAVDGVNDAPTINPEDNLALMEHAGLQTIIMDGINAGPGENQTLTITAMSSDTGLIPHPTVTYTSPSTTGTLNFQPVDDMVGTATITVIVSDDGGTANGGRDSVTNTFRVIVTYSAETLDHIPDLTILENAGMQTVNLSGITAGSGDPDDVFVIASSSNPALIPHPTVNYTSPSTTGSLNFTPVADTSGTVTITVVVFDDESGLGIPDADACTNLFTVTVTPVNNAPTLAALSGLTILEDAAVQTVNLSGITAGGSESQTLTVSATSSDTGIIPNPSATYTSANTTGSLRFTPATNAFGTVTISVVVSDNGGTANGGVNSVTNTFTVAVDAVNDTPSFVKGASQSAEKNSGAHTVAGWATGISAGAANESGQALTFVVTNNNHALFSVQPAVSAAGTLTYTLAEGASGSATVWVQLQDDGGGSDTSAGQTFTISVSSPLGMPVAYATGAGANSISLADYDGDGNVDIFVGNFSGNSVSMLRNPGDGTFVAPVNYTVGNNPSSIGLGDFNGDGKRDLAVANYSDNTLSILIGAGKMATWRMTNAVPPTVTVGRGPIAVGVIDGAGLNGDGKQDIAVVNYLDNNVSILLGRGDGTFSNAVPATVAVGTQPTALISVDLNGDSKRDLAVANSGDKTLTILIGNSDGTFTDGGTVSVGANPRGLTATDLNGDGTQDLVVANKDDDTVTVLLGNGAGVFTNTSELTLTGGSLPGGVWVGDINGDGKQDVLTANTGQDTVTIFYGRGDGSFDAGQTFATGSQPVAVAVRALSPKSLPAIVTANNGDGSVSVLQNLIPMAFSTALTLNEDMTASVNLLGAGSGMLTYTLVSGPTNGVILSNAVVIPAGAYPVRLPAGLSNSLVYRPGTNFYGADRLFFSVEGGGLTSTPASVTFTVRAANDVPTFTLNTNLLSAVNEDCPTNVTVANFGTNILAGPSNELGQTVSFVLKTTNSAFFTMQPTISPAGLLTFRPKPNTNGVQWVQVYARDSGGAPYSSTQTFAIVVSPVNDRPTISAIANRNAYEDRATNISFTIGDIDTALGSLVVSATSSNATVVPDSNLILGGSGANRTLLVTPVANKIGQTLITITVNDGQLSTNRTFTLNFLAVNDAPSFTLAGTNVIAGMNCSSTNAGWASAIRPGPTDATDEAGQKVSFLLSNNNPALFSTQPVMATNGTLTFRPVSNGVGIATVTVVARDSGNTLYGGVNQSTQAFTITVMAVPMRPGNLILADRGPLGVGASVHGGTAGGSIILINTNTGAQTVLTTNIIDPSGIALAANGDLIVADYDAVLDDPSLNRGVVYRVDRLTLATTILARAGDFAEPFAVAVEPDGNILVADSDAYSLAGAVFRVDPNSGAQTALSSDNMFRHLSGLAVAANGSVYVSDLGDGVSIPARIIQVDSFSGAQTEISSGGYFSQPTGLAVDPGTGDLIVVDAAAQALIRVNTATGAQTVISSGGSFIEPTHIAIDASGDFLVTDGSSASTSSERRVYRVDKNTGAQSIVTFGDKLEQPRGLTIVR